MRVPSRSAAPDNGMLSERPYHRSRRTLAAVGCSRRFPGESHRRTCHTALPSRALEDESLSLAPSGAGGGGLLVITPPRQRRTIKTVRGEPHSSEERRGGKGGDSTGR